MSSINTEKIRQNADLINPISACPFGEPIAECPFVPFYVIKDERKQIEQIEVIPQRELDELRKFHRTCMERYREGLWESKGSQVNNGKNSHRKQIHPPTQQFLNFLRITISCIKTALPRNNL